MSIPLALVLALIARCSLVLCFAPSMEADWEYMFTKTAWNSSNEDLFRTDIRPVRIERGVYALNGTVVVGVDVDDSFTFAIQMLYSANGSGQWTSTPFEVKTVSFYKFMNSAYKEYLNEDVSKCAGTPYVGDEEYKEPFKASTIFANNCMVKTSNMPRHLRPGYYKLSLQLIGPPVEFYAEVVAKIFEKNS